MPTIDQLRYILAVAEHRHFGKASKACRVSQPSLSAQIQKVEEVLGVVLFDRSKKPILTTQPGQAVIDQAKIVLREHQKLQAVADQDSFHPRGDFHLGVIPTLAPYVVPQFVGEFSKNYADVHLKITEYKTDEIIGRLVDDKLDAGLLVTPLRDHRLIERHLFFETFFVYVSKGHPLFDRTWIDEKSLSYDGLWLLEEGHCFRKQVLQVCSRDRSPKVFPNVDFESGNLETLIKLVNQNRGYTLLPKLATKDFSKAEQKKHIRSFHKPIPTREVSLVYSRSFLKENILDALEETIVDTLPQDIHSLKKKNLTIIDV